MKNAIAEDRLRLPSLDCPNPSCTAKNIAFEVNREAKNDSELIPLEYDSENIPADFAAICPKCKSKYVLYRHRETPIIPYTAIYLYGRIADITEYFGIVNRPPARECGSKGQVSSPERIPQHEYCA